ncbi:hypothetical protein N5F23_01530 [Pseudomonas sichuanensis]|uniref:HNH endonuclease n=1 Tax=Pseudomonas sichuanensis TaxID=2213015 RepID=UPI0024496ADE|nr:hypothetical protein [Pseudomonas sichuanensis]MDH0730140.1 hypothetical protein [Pseudomonas sichuanensis]MDH1581276.1 hypothetical protein [Pseudomonas sichuanensis]MDH1593437.1 hypothetical protein [Pseudomonas sichuanensis]MDH1597192.1 hypothetical protein [Pseudomonas sichuanensis]
MKAFNVISKERIDAVNEEYRDKCHSVQSHKAGTYRLLETFAAMARDEFNLRKTGDTKTPGDLWTKLYNHNNQKTSGVTGKLLRKHLRDFLEQEQGHKCCYCQRPLVNISHAKPIEHILPRQPFVQHTFNFWNLAVACFDCNHAKSNKFWASPAPPTVADYPKPEEFINSYHPRFHIYDEHVQFVRVQTNTVNISIYIGQTEQGKELCKNLLKTISAKDILLCSNLALKESIDKLYDYMPSLGEEAASAVEDFNISLSSIALKLIEDV